MLFSAESIAEAVSGIWSGLPENDLTGVFTDTRTDGSGKLFFALAGERFDAHDFLDKAVASGAAALCVRRGAAVPEGIPVLEVEDTLKAYQDLGAYCKKSVSGLKTAAVTGSVGKTSVKEMLRAIFSYAAGEDRVLATSGNTNNHIGVPQNLLKLADHHRFAVLEMGMSHPGEILPLSMMVRPDTAVVNSIAPCHIGNLGSLEGIAEEKGSVFKGLSADGTAVIPAGIPQTEILVKAALPHKILRFGTTEDCDVRAAYAGGRIDGSDFTLSFKNAGTFQVSWGLSGRHQAVNAAAAAAAAWSLGISPEDICSALPATVLPGMRSKITVIDGTTYINDAYNANPASMAAALDYLEEFVSPEKLILLLGAMLELGTESDLRHCELLISARKRFPEARIFTFGKPFSSAAEQHGIPFFEKPEEFAGTLAGMVLSGCIVFAKGSRGIGMENALPDRAR